MAESGKSATFPSKIPSKSTVELKVQGGTGGRGLGLVDFDLGHSATCPVVLGQMGLWLNRLCSCATWWIIYIKVNLTQVHDTQPHPVLKEYLNCWFIYWVKYNKLTFVIVSAIGLIPVEVSG